VPFFGPILGHPIFKKNAHRIGLAPLPFPRRCIVASGTVCRADHTLLTWAVHGITGYQIVSHQVFLTGGQTTNVHVDCPEGKKVLGGGFDIETPDFVKVFSSEPSDGAGNFSEHAWNVFARNNDDTRLRQVTVSAICALLQ
jgi:hypothetical protein